MGINRIAASLTPIPLRSEGRTLLLSSPLPQKHITEEARRSVLASIFAFIGLGGKLEEVSLSDADVKRWCEEGGQLPPIMEPPAYDAHALRNFTVHVHACRPEATLSALHSIVESGNEILGRLSVACEEVALSVQNTVQGQTFQNVTRRMASKMALACAEVAANVADRSLAQRERILREAQRRQRPRQDPPEYPGGDD